MDHIFDPNQPIYLQIVQRICASILRGEYQPGDKLPGVIDAAMYFKVNHNTIQRVYQELIRQGIAITRRGEGTFVTTDEEVLKSLHVTLRQAFLEDFFRQMQQLGYSDEDILEAIRSYIRQKDGSAQ
ncbi:MAG: GntR family transcriptional regulator [Chloroflexi bacterium]|nr:GntR family transcriptional regulator [Chloroflexota bacterium]